MLEPVLIYDASHTPARKEVVACIAEQPLRNPYLCVDLERGNDCPFLLRVKIPPTSSIGNEPQRSIRRPLGLKNRFGRRARDRPRISNGSIGIEVADPQLSAVPWHLRM